MSKILVTGGLGYIGSHTVIQLINNGFNVIIIDNCSNSNIETLDKIKQICNIKELPYYNLNLCDQSQVDYVFSLHQNIYTVIHFAAFKSVPESISDPSTYYYNNLTSLTNVLNSMKKFDCMNLIFSSSATVYGSIKPPFNEDSETGIGITNPYGQTKYICEEILKKTSTLYPKMNLIILRYFNPVGAHQSGLIGEDINSPNLMPNIMKSISYNKPFKLYGNSYSTLDGSCVRDFIHVEDLANAHILSIQTLRHNPNYKVYNVGSGRGYSVLEILDCMNTYNKEPIQIQLEPQRPGDLPIIYSNITKIKKELGWKPIKTLDDICKDTLIAFKKS